MSGPDPVQGRVVPRASDDTQAVRRAYERDESRAGMTRRTVLDLCDALDRARAEPAEARLQHREDVSDAEAERDALKAAMERVQAWAEQNTRLTALDGVELRAAIGAGAEPAAECSCGGPSPSGWHESSCATIQPTAPGFAPTPPGTHPANVARCPHGAPLHTCQVQTCVEPTGLLSTDCRRCGHVRNWHRNGAALVCAVRGCECPNFYPAATGERHEYRPDGWGVLGERACSHVINGRGMTCGQPADAAVHR